MSTLRSFKSLPDLVLARDSDLGLGGWGDWRVGNHHPPSDDLGGWGDWRVGGRSTCIAREEMGLLSDEGQEWQKRNQQWVSQAEEGSQVTSKRLFKAGAGLAQL